MSFINLTGVIVDPDGAYSVGDEFRFVHQTTTGSTIKGAISSFVVPLDGSYNIDLQYGNILIEYKPIETGSFEVQGIVTVNQDTLVTTLPELLNSTVPPTDSQILVFQQLVAQANAEADRAESEADRAEAAASSVVGFDPTSNQTITGDWEFKGLTEFNPVSISDLDSLTNYSQFYQAPAGALNFPTTAGNNWAGVRLTGHNQDYVDIVASTNYSDGSLLRYRTWGGSEWVKILTESTNATMTGNVNFTGALTKNGSPVLAENSVAVLTGSISFNPSDTADISTLGNTARFFQSQNTAAGYPTEASGSWGGVRITGAGGSYYDLVAGTSFNGDQLFYKAYTSTTESSWHRIVTDAMDVDFTGALQKNGVDVATVNDIPADFNGGTITTNLVVSNNTPFITVKSNDSGNSYIQWMNMANESTGQIYFSDSGLGHLKVGKSAATHFFREDGDVEFANRVYANGFNLENTQDLILLQPEANGSQIGNDGIYSSARGNFQIGIRTRDGNETLTDLVILNTTNGTSEAWVSLNYNTSQKLRTTNTGVTVTGAVNEVSDERLKTDIKAESVNLDALRESSSEGLLSSYILNPPEIKKEKRRKDLKSKDRALKKSKRGAKVDQNEVIEVAEDQSSIQTSGSLAQTIEKILPCAVTDNDDGFKQINNSAMRGGTLLLLKQVLEMVDNQAAEIEALKKTIEGMNNG